MTTRTMISFDWAIKRLLRNKANFEVLEGFLSELLKRKINIKYIGESEGNQTDKTDKYNRVDVLVEADDSELVIIELQFDEQYDYFQRMLFGTSKAITDNMEKGTPYSKVRKLYSINIVHFDLGQGEDYIYHGATTFKGYRKHDELKLNIEQREVYQKTYPGELYPEYYILKVMNFDDVATDTLDEWIYYLKNNKIKDEFTAKGIAIAKELLALENLSEKEKKAYFEQVERNRVNESVHQTALYKERMEGKAIGLEEGEAIGLEKGRAEGEAIGMEKTALNMLRDGMTAEMASKYTGLTIQQIDNLRKKRQEIEDRRQ